MTYDMLVVTLLTLAVWTVQIVVRLEKEER